jgi:hypothetical protein
MKEKETLKSSIKVVVLGALLLLGVSSLLLGRQFLTQSPSEKGSVTISSSPTKLKYFKDNFDIGILNDDWWTVVKSDDSSYGLVSGSLEIVLGLASTDYLRLEPKKDSMMDFNLSSDFDLSQFSGGEAVFGVFDSTRDPQNGYSIDISMGATSSELVAKTLLNGEVKVVGSKDIASDEILNLKIARRGSVVTFWTDLDSLGVAESGVYDKGVKSVVMVNKISGTDFSPRLVLDNFYLEEK